MNLSKLWSDIAQNAGFLLVVVLIAAALVLAAKLLQREFCTGLTPQKRSVKIAVIGMMSAAAFVLQIFEFPLPFLAPSFYELDFSEVPIMICAFAMGPVAGVAAELVKNVLKILIRGTSTAFVGDFANFAVGCSLVLPASAIYCRSKKRSAAVFGCAVGTLAITLFGSLFNAFYLLPAFSKLYGMDLDAIIGMGAAVFPQIKNFTITHFVFCCVAPINLIKGASVSLIILLIYKPLERVLHQQY